MKEHPIPQDITGYRFHIVGSMTLKQFGEVLVGVLISLAIYKTNLIFLIKWPLIILFFGGGLLSAFIPIEERPISHWIATFFGILYKPTQFFWKRTQNIPPAFLYEGNKENLITVKEVDLTPARRQRIKEFLSSTKTITPAEEDLTYQEQQHISSVLDLFQSTMTPIASASGTVVQKPDLTVRVRSLRMTATTTEPTIPQPTDHSWEDLLAAEQQTAQPTAPILPTPIVREETKYDETKDVFLKTEEVAQNIVIPEHTVISVKPTVEEAVQQVIVTPKLSDQSERAFVENAVPVEDKKSTPAAAATFNKSLPFPDKPTVPNKLVGMVLTKSQEIIPNAIVEISTEDGHVVRAVKTNALGQFFITTPLKSGKYLVNVQKDGFSFDSVKIELKNKIVDPLEIKSAD